MLLECISCGFKHYLRKLEKFEMLGARLVDVFKNWKLLFENICENTYGWKSV